MPSYDFDWVDAFTATKMAGNPCMVVYDAADIAVADRLRLVRETRLSECAFLIPSAKADFGVRYYLADREIPLAGHPTVATIASLVSRGLIDLSETPAHLTLEVGAGVIDIEVTGSVANPVVTMTQPAPVFGETSSAESIAQICGLPEGSIEGTPQIVSTGAGHCIAVVSSAAVLASAQLDPERLAAWQARLETTDAAHIEPFLVTLSGATPQGDTFARLMLPPPMPPEDPFTGSATGEMAAYLWHHGLIDAPSFQAEQGQLMGRPGQARVEVLGPRDAITGVRVGGPGVVLMRGTLDL